MIAEVIVVAFVFTCDDHHAYGEDLLVVGLGGQVAEAHARHARHGVVQGRHVHGLARGPALQLEPHDRRVVSAVLHDLPEVDITCTLDLLIPQ